MRVLCLSLAFLLFSTFVSCQSPPASASGYYYPDAVQRLLDMVQSLNITGLKNNTLCWKDSYGRGVGHVIDTCATDLQKDGALCYPHCKVGYYGVGPVCWESCKAGYTDEGALCAINVEIISSDNSQCPWYDVCGLVGAKGCSKCPDDSWINDGCTCRHDADIYAKDSYGRGAGVPLGCSATEQFDAALCYPYCKDSYSGVGPVCWGSCPSKIPVDDGALCCVDQSTCDERIKQMAMGILSAIASAVEGGATFPAIMNDIKKAIEAILNFILPNCASIHEPHIAIELF